MYAVCAVVVCDVDFFYAVAIGAAKCDLGGGDPGGVEQEFYAFVGEDVG